MTDTVIKNTGNSRTLKTVANFLLLYPTYEDFAQAFIMGQLHVDIGNLVATGVSTMGTDLNKANMLSDATETAIWGSAANRTPNQAFEKLRSLITTAQTTADGKASIATGSYLGTVDHQIEFENNAFSLTFPFHPLFVVIMSSESMGIYVIKSGYGWYARRGSSEDSCWALTCSGSDKTIYFDSQYRGLNALNKRYYYVAIG